MIIRSGKAAPQKNGKKKYELFHVHLVFSIRPFVTSRQVGAAMIARHLK